MLSKFFYIKGNSRLVIFVCLLCSISCAIGPDYKEPDLALSPSFDEENIKNAISSDSQEFEDQLWWESFKDENLTELIVTAVHENKEVEQAIQRVNQSRALAKEAFTNLLPGALINSSYEKAKTSSARFPSPAARGFTYEVYSGKLDASWEIDIFGGLRRGLEAADAEYAAGVYSLQDAIRVLISDVAISYFQMIAAKQRLEVANENLKIVEESFSIVKAKREYGEVGELDLQRAKMEVMQAQAVIAPFESLVKINAHRLAVLCGKQPTFYYELSKKELTLPKYSGPKTIAKPEELLKSRPDIKIAERKLAAETARVGVAYSNLFPKINIVGAFGLESATFSGLDKDAQIYRFGPAISWAIFDTGKLRARIKSAKSKAKEALSNYESVVLKALEEVENSLVRFSSENEKSFHIYNAHQASKKAFEIAELQYKEGEIDFLRFLDVQKAMLELRSQLVDTKESKLISLISIYKSLGSGWENIDASTSQM